MSAIITIGLPDDRAADRLAIDQLVNRYACLLDAFEVEPLCALFTDDCQLDQRAMGTGHQKGLGELRDFFASLRGVIAHQMHSIGTRLCDFESDTVASGIVYTIAEAHGASGKLRAGVRYDDEYHRTDAGWRIYRRRISPLIPMEDSGLFKE